MADTNGVAAASASEQTNVTLTEKQLKKQAKKDAKKAKFEKKQEQAKKEQQAAGEVIDQFALSFFFLGQLQLSLSRNRRRKRTRRQRRKCSRMTSRSLRGRRKVRGKAS